VNRNDNNKIRQEILDSGYDGLKYVYTTVKNLNVTIDMLGYQKNINKLNHLGLGNQITGIATTADAIRAGSYVRMWSIYVMILRSGKA